MDFVPGFDAKQVLGASIDKDRRLVQITYLRSDGSNDELTIPFLIISDFLNCLTHLQSEAAKVSSPDRGANLLLVQKGIAASLPGGDVRLSLETVDRMTFQFQIQNTVAAQLASALSSLCMPSAPVSSRH